jgi:hypothetical protein|tara:strand:- start:110 stop:520 length:411 start_codon:yes stop_codon:yes gene_type:complete
MNLKSLPLVVKSHGIAAMAFALSFFLEAYEIHLPLLSIKAQHPSLMLNEFAFIGLLFAGAGTLTFASYEIFLIPKFLKTLEIGSSFRKRAKSIFTIYHIVWCIAVTILVLLPSASPAAYINIFVMYGFTFWGLISK